MGRPGKIAHLEMPSWLRGSFLESRARRFARAIKSAGLSLERLIRRGRVKVKLPSVDEWLWLDFDFATVHTLPAEDPLLAAFLSHLRPGQVVYDVGSFVGTYALAAAKRLGEGRVFAFEPAPASAHLMRRHCELNGLTDRVRVIEAACSSVSGACMMPVWPTGTTTWASGNALRNVYPQEGVAPTPTPVCTLSLDDFVHAGTGRPDVLKIDVEGAELWVLQGARRTLEAARPLVFLEVHSFAWRLFDTTEAMFREYIATLGYGLFHATPPYSHMTSIPEYGHAILRPGK